MGSGLFFPNPFEVRLLTQSRAPLNVRTGNFNIHKVDLQFLFRLDSDKERRTTPRGNDLIGEINTLEYKGKRALELLQDDFDEGSEVKPSPSLGIPDVLEEHSDNFRISLTFKFVPFLLEHEAQCIIVSDDTVVDDGEFVSRIRTERMAIDGRWSAMGRPTSVRNRNLVNKGLLEVNIGLCD